MKFIARDKVSIFLSLLVFSACGMQNEKKPVPLFCDFEEKNDTECLEAIFKEDYKNLISGSDEYKIGDGVKTFTSTVSDAKINKRSIMRINNKSVAFIIYFVLEKNSFNKNFYDGDVALTLMGVHPDERNKGYGSSIMKYFKSSSKLLGAQKIWLSVNKNNTIAQKLYKNFGFFNTGKTSWGESHWWSAYIFNSEINKRALYDQLIDKKFCDINLKFHKN